MKRAIYFGVTLLSTTQLAAQDQRAVWDIPLLQEDTSKYSWLCTAESNFFVGSASLTNGFINTLYLGGFIDAEMKNHQYDRLSEKNVVGAAAGMRFGGQWKDQKKPITHISWADRRLIFNGSFPPDALRLAMDGNQQFKGQTANADRTKFDYFSFTTFGYGQERSVFNNRLQVQWTAGLILAHQYSSLQLDKARINTDNLGLFVDMDVEGTFRTSDTASQKLTDINGTGITTGLRLSGNWGTSARFGWWAGVQDAGIISWNNKGYVYRVDTSYTFTGVLLPNDFLNSENVIETPAVDSFYTISSGSTYTGVLPLNISGGVQARFNNGWYNAVQLHWWSTNHEQPMIRIHSGWMNNTGTFSAVSGISYGGFAALQVPLSVRFTLMKKFTTGIHCDNVMALVSSTSTGQGAFLQLAYRL
jgi:hypothetical protein